MTFDPDRVIVLPSELARGSSDVTGLKIAIVGIGYWGSKLLRNLIDLVGIDNVVAIDCSTDRRAAARRLYPGLAIAGTLEQASDLHDIEAVVIATPAETHTKVALIALSHGMHALVEKPLTTSIQEAEQLMNIASDRGLVLMVGHTFLFSPPVRWMAEHIAKGMIGRIHYVTSSRQNLHGHNGRTNVIWDLCPHDFSIIFELLDERPLSVRATARGLLRSDVPDVAFITLDFPSGAIASIDVSWTAPKKARKTTVVGDAGMIVYNDLQDDEPIKVYDPSIEGHSGVNSAIDENIRYHLGDTRSPHIPNEEPLREELTAFISAVHRRDTAPPSGVHFALDVIRTLQAADASWRRGGETVTIDRHTHMTPVRSWSNPIDNDAVESAAVAT